MKRRSPELDEILHVNRQLKEITFQDQRAGIIKVLAGGESTGKHGYNFSALLGDEFCHPIPGMREIMTDLRHGGMSREQPLFISISTAGSFPDAYGMDLWKEAHAARDNPEAYPELLPVIHAVPLDSDWMDKENWKLANPSMGETVQADYYEKEFEKAKLSPALEASFRTRLLCQPVGSSEQPIPTYVWDKCAEDFDEERFHHCEAYLGMDAAVVRDIFSYVLVVREGEDHYIIPRAFLPRDNIEQKQVADGCNYSLWGKQGYLTLTEGNVVDHRAVKERLLQDQKDFVIQECGYDRAAGASLLIQSLQDDHGFNCVEVPQTLPSLSPATHHFEKLCFAGKIHHPNNPVLNYCLNNCAITRRGNLLGYQKVKSTRRIDCITATLIALNRCLANPYEISAPFWA